MNIMWLIQIFLFALLFYLGVNCPSNGANKSQSLAKKKRCLTEKEFILLHGALNIFLRKFICNNKVKYRPYI